MDLSTDERDQPDEIEAGPRPEESELEDLNLLDDDFANDGEEGDVLGSLPQLQMIPSTLSTQNAEYALTIPMSVSSMSFSISPSMSSTMSFSAYTSPSFIDQEYSSKRISAFDNVLSDDASDADVEDYSAYLSLYSAYTDYTGYTANTANTNATDFSTLSNSSMMSTQLVPSTASCGPMSCFEADGDEEEEMHMEEQEEAEETACVPVEPVVEPPVENGDAQTNEEEDAEKSASNEESTFGCFSDMSWLQCPLFNTTPEEQSHDIAINNAIVIRNSNNLFVPSVLSAQRRMGREDLLRLAIATILKLVAEHSASARESAPSTSTSLARKACSDVVVYQPSSTSAPRIPVASTTTASQDVPPSQAPRDAPSSGPCEQLTQVPCIPDATSIASSPETSPVLVASSSESTLVSLGADATECYDEKTAARSENLADSKRLEVDQETVCSERQSMPTMSGGASFPIDTCMLLSSADLATGVMLELEANGLFLNAADKFNAMDEEAQVRFINRNNHSLLGPSQPLPETKSREGEEEVEPELPKEIDSKTSTSKQVITGATSGREREEAFFQALLLLVSSSISNALEEISGYFNTSYAAATEESVERMAAVTAPKAVAKIIEEDIMEQLETSSVIDEIPAIEKMAAVPVKEEGVEFSVEQHKALRQSETLFDAGISFTLSRYLQAVKKAKAHFAIKRSLSARPEGIPNVEVPPSEGVPKVEIPPSAQNQQLEKTKDTSKCRIIKSRVVPLDPKRPGIDEDYFKDIVAKNSNAEKSTEPVGLLGMLPPLETSSLMRFFDIFPSVIPAPSDSMDKQCSDESKNTAVSEPNGNEKETNVRGSADTKQEPPTSKMMLTSDINERALAPKKRREVSIPKSKPIEVDDAEDICHRIVQEHIKRKKKVEKAKKLAIQEHLHKSRSGKASMTSTISTDSRTMNSGTTVKTRTGVKKVKKLAPPRPQRQERKDQVDMPRNYPRRSGPR